MQPQIADALGAECEAIADLSGRAPKIVKMPASGILGAFMACVSYLTRGA